MDAKRGNDAVNSEACDITGATGPGAGWTNGPSSLSSFSSRLQQSLEIFPKELASVKGDVEESYWKDSAVQAFVSKVSLLALDDALEKVTLPSREDPVLVADLSSSSGPHSVRNMAHIIDKLRQRVPEDAEFRALFNDESYNDFNNLFKLWNNDGTGPKNVYPGGVPGSFFERIFGQSSVHVFHSSNCLPFLSKVPDDVLDKNGPAYNRGKTWIWHTQTAVAESYQRQASLDLKNFLQTKAKELVPGGLLFFFTVGRSTSNPNEPTNTFLRKSSKDLDDVLKHLVGEGLLMERQRDTFNIRCYERSIEELREAVVYCGSFFDVLTLEMHRIDLSYSEVFETSEATVLSKRLVTAFKSMIGISLEDHFGEKLSEVIWTRYQKFVEKKIRMSSDEDLKMTNSIIVVLSEESSVILHAVVHSTMFALVRTMRTYTCWQKFSGFFPRKLQSRELDIHEIRGGGDCVRKQRQGRHKLQQVEDGRGQGGAWGRG